MSNHTAKAIAATCSKCGSAAEFGYKIKGGMQWFCAEHRLAKHYADARVSKAVEPAPRNDPLAEHANAIRQHVEAFRTRTIQEIVEIGKHLVAAKELCGHGSWLPWLRKEFGWSEGIAHRFMQVSRMPPDQIRKLVNLDLPVSTVYELAAPSTPAAVRDDVIERVESGKPVSVQQVRSTIAIHKANQKPKPSLPSDKPAPAGPKPPSPAKIIAKVSAAFMELPLGTTSQVECIMRLIELMERPTRADFDKAYHAKYQNRTAA